MHQTCCKLDAGFAEVEFCCKIHGKNQNEDFIKNEVNVLEIKILPNQNVLRIDILILRNAETVPICAKLHGNFSRTDSAPMSYF